MNISYSTACGRYYTITGTGAWCFLSFADVDSMLAAIAPRLLVGLALRLSLVRLAEINRAAQERAIMAKPKDGAVRQGPTPAEAERMRRVALWWTPLEASP